jgi:hypothetical protein
MSRRENGTAVPGSEVDDGPAMSPGQSGQLADVDVDDPAALHDAHGAQYASNQRGGSRITIEIGRVVPFR